MARTSPLILCRLNWSQLFPDINSCTVFKCLQLILVEHYQVIKSHTLNMQEGRNHEGMPQLFLDNILFFKALAALYLHSIIDTMRLVDQQV